MKKNRQKGIEFTNSGATYLTLYGVKPGQSKSEAVNTWKQMEKFMK